MQESLNPIRNPHWDRKQQPTPVFLPGKFCGQRSLAGYNPWGHRGSDTTERTHPCSHTHTHTAWLNQKQKGPGGPVAQQGGKLTSPAWDRRSGGILCAPWIFWGVQPQQWLPSHPLEWVSLSPPLSPCSLPPASWDHFPLDKLRLILVSGSACREHPQDKCLPCEVAVSTKTENSCKVLRKKIKNSLQVI